jgi:hypothetical protein
MILGDFCDVEGPKPVGFSHGQFRLVVQATVRAAATRLWTCGQRKRVAHMPTTTTTDAEAHQCWISKQAITGRTHIRKTRQTTHRFRRGGQNIYDAPIGATTSVGHTGSAWGFDFSIDVNSSGSTGLALADVTASLTLTDVNQHTTGSFNPLTYIGDNATVGNHAAQNSETLSYASIAGALGDSGFNVNAYDTYDFTLSVTCANCGCLHQRPGSCLGLDDRSNRARAGVDGTPGLRAGWPRFRSVQEQGYRHQLKTQAI